MATQASAGPPRLKRLGVFYLGVVIGAAGAALVVHSLNKRPFLSGRANEASEADVHLDQVLTRVDWDEMPFDQAIEQLRKLTKADIYVDRKAMTAAGVDVRTPVSAHVRYVTLSRLLAKIGDQLGGGMVKIAFGPADGVILISTPDALPLRAFVRVYDVRDIVPTYAVLPDPDVNTVFDAPPPRISASSEKDRGEALVKLIEDTVATDSWRQNGGSVAACRYLAGNVIIYAPTEMHRQVQNLLRQIREELPAAAPPPRIAASTGGSSEWTVYPLPSGELKEALRKPLGQIALEAVPLDEAVDRLAQVSKVQLVLDQHALNTIGLRGDEKVTLSGQNASLSDALNGLTTRPVNGVTLGYIVDGDSILVTTHRRLDERQPVVIYNVRDLIPKIGYTPRTGADQRSRGQMIDDLIRLIETTVARESWKDNGGTLGAIRQMYGELIVTQSWENHQKIKRLLERLREHGMTLYPVENSPARSATGPSQDGQRPRTIAR